MQINTELTVANTILAQMGGSARLYAMLGAHSFTGDEASLTFRWKAQMLKELQSDMADLVASGDMTPEQANEWVNAKADQWANGRG